MGSPVQDLSVLHQRREQRLMLALALPALLVILLLVVLPVGWLAWQSVYHNGFTLENYRRIWSEDIYWRSFALTFEISLLVTLLALLLGYPIAYAASVAPKRWGIIILALVAWEEVRELVLCIALESEWRLIKRPAVRICQRAFEKKEAVVNCYIQD